MNIHYRFIFKSKNFILVLCLMLISTITFAENMCFASLRTPCLNMKTLSLVKGKSYKLKLYNTTSNHTISFESADESIVIIKKVKKKDCHIKALSLGQTTITAYITNNLTDKTEQLSCDVIVTPPGVTVKFNKKKIKVPLGSSKKAKISIKPATSDEIPRFSSDDPSIASVSSNGIITGNKPGKVVVRVSIGNGRDATCNVTIIEPKKNHSIVPDNYNLIQNNVSSEDNNDLIDSSNDTNTSNTFKSKNKKNKKNKKQNDNTFYYR